MATTPKYALRYPDAAMPADVPTDMGKLATDTENTISGQVDPLSGRVGALESQFAAFAAFDPGDLKVSARATAPTGWLLCDGSAVSRTTYSALFAAIGTAYGPGDGSSSFNLPDFRGRTIVGVGVHADVAARGLNDGALPGNRRPKHKHTVGNDTPPHRHQMRASTGQAGPSHYAFPAPFDLADMPIDSYTEPPQVPHTHAVGPQTGAEPTDSAAYLTANVFIKT